jgi:hypothetical protein
MLAHRTRSQSAVSRVRLVGTQVRPHDCMRRRHRPPRDLRQPTGSPVKAIGGHFRVSRLLNPGTKRCCELSQLRRSAVCWPIIARPQGCQTLAPLTLGDRTPSRLGRRGAARAWVASPSARPHRERRCRRAAPQSARLNPLNAWLRRPAPGETPAFLAPERRCRRDGDRPARNRRRYR